MSKLVKRPDYITYRLNCPKNYDDKQWPAIIKQFENEPAIVQWHMPHNFMWKDSALIFHTKVLWLPVLILVSIFIAGIGTINSYFAGFTPTFIVCAIFLFLLFGFIYYISRSQYYNIAYKITESGLLFDCVKLYPRFRYREQDTTNFYRWFRWVAVVVGLFALFTDPMYLAGAGGAIFISFMKPEKDAAEPAIYGAFFGGEENDNSRIYLVEVNKKRRIIDLHSKGYVTGCDVYCSKDNFEEVLVFVTEKLPNAEFVYVE